MKKRIAISVDDDVYEGLKLVPRGFSVSEFLTFMLRGMLKEVAQGRLFSQEEFDAWVNSDPQLKKVKEGMREAWGPAVWKAADKVKDVKEGVKGKMKNIKGKKDV